MQICLYHHVVGLTSDAALRILRGLGEPTRLRIVALLRHGELTVSDLVDILRQSQPRISRHLRLLTEAGIVERHREGSWVYVRLVDDAATRALTTAAIDSIDTDDSTWAADHHRLHVVIERRNAAARDYFSQIAERWDEVRSLRAPDDVVEDAILDLLGDRTDKTMADLGTGTGRMIQLLASPRHTRLVGIDTNHSMLAVARANLADLDPAVVELHQGDIARLPYEPSSFDLVIIHQVLHFLADPAQAIERAAQLLTPHGRLLIIDFAPHQVEFLRTEHAHRRLGISHDTMASWCTAAGLTIAERRTITPPDPGQLTVELWLAEVAP